MRLRDIPKSILKGKDRLLVFRRVER